MVEREIIQRLFFVKLIAVAVIVRRINIKDGVQIFFCKPIFLFGKLLIQVFSAHVMQHTDKAHVVVSWVAAAFKNMWSGSIASVHESGISSSFASQLSLTNI